MRKANIRDYCSLTYNGHILDREVPGFTTINVENRDLYSPELQTESIQYRDGDILMGSQYPARDIIVHYQLEGENARDYRKKINLLNAFLYSKDNVTFSFGDEMGYRVGRLSEAEGFPFDDFKGFGTLTIHADPWRYIPITKKGEVITLDTDGLGIHAEEVQIDSLKFALKAESSSITVKSKFKGRKDEVIRLSRPSKPFKSGARIFLDFNQSKIEDTGYPINDAVDFEVSKFPDLPMELGSQIVVENASSVSIDYRLKVI